MALTPGTRLGVYEITAPIGEGGMGQVWRATDTTLGRQVAIKILPDVFAADPERLARFERDRPSSVTTSSNWRGRCSCTAPPRFMGPLTSSIHRITGPSTPSYLEEAGDGHEHHADGHGHHHVIHEVGIGHQR